MFCKECGKSIDDDSKYCRYCGTSQNNPESVPPSIKPQSRGVNVTSPPYKGPLESDSKVSEKKPSPDRKYDESYRKEIEATIVGVFVLFIDLIIAISISAGGTNLENHNLLIMAAISFILRILTTIWVVSIAERQNRDPLGWGIFGFLSPILALIIIGLMRKKYKETKNVVTQVEHIGSIDNKPKMESDLKELMGKYNICFDNGQYIYLTYKYDSLIDAINYAELKERKN